MSIQGHIENGVVVLDVPSSLPNGTVVRVEPVESSGAVLADTARACAVQEMAHAWNEIAKPIPESDTPMAVDPDDYPLF